VSRTALIGLAFGALVGAAAVLALLGAAAPGFGAGTLLFPGAAFGFALGPYLVFAALERGRSRSVAVPLLMLIGALHIAATALLVDGLDEDALTSLGFLILPPLLLVPLGAADLLVRVAGRLG